MRAVDIATACVLGSRGVWAKVCSPEECIKGSSSSPLLLHDKTTDIYLTPGIYTPDSPHLDLHQTLDSFHPSPSLNQSSIRVGSNLFISPPDHAVLFSNKRYSGNIRSADGEWKSVYLPPGFYGLVTPGKAVWGGVADISQIKGIPSSFSFMGLDRCDPPCSSAGVCVLDGGSAGRCECKEGWAGTGCDTCVKGHYGPECKACSDDCSVCDDGLGGTGKCIGTSTTPLKKCNCAHGTCTDSGECTCAAGYSTNSTSTSNSLKCSECAVGSYKDTSDNCLACPLGCASCALREGSSGSPTCTSCVADLRLNTADPALCVSSGTCPSGQYFDTNTQTCRGCSPACNTCTGPSTSECLSCASPRVNLAGNCVGFETSTGICDSELSGLQGVFVVNNEKSRCDSCPVGCASCIIPSFSSAVPYSSASCRTCQDGYLLQDGSCVKTCSEGWYLPEGGSNNNGTCQRCDASCTTCIGSSTTCTKCPPPTFASNGACIDLCPSTTIPSNGSCIACSPDCSTCSSPSASSCLTCPPNRPVLSTGRCLDHCPKDQFFDVTLKTCQKCDSTCASCLGSFNQECSSCPEGSILKSGQCVRSECKYGQVGGLGICLEDLITMRSGNTRYLGFLAFILVVLVLGFGAWWYVKKQREKTRSATKEFADAIDDKDVRDRMMILRLERVLGLDRLRPVKEVPRLVEEGERKERERLRLRELLLISRKRKDRGKGRDNSSDIEDGIRLTDRPQTGKADLDIGSSSNPSWYNAPPPPYIGPSESSSSTLHLDNKSQYGEGGGGGGKERLVRFEDPANLPPLKTKFISMSSSSSASPVTPTFHPSALRPPLRSHTSKSSISISSGSGDVGGTASGSYRVPLGQGKEDGKEIERGTSGASNRRISLKRLWPAMPSPVFGEVEEDGKRKAEGWV